MRGTLDPAPFPGGVSGAGKVDPGRLAAALGVAAVLAYASYGKFTQPGGLKMPWDALIVGGQAVVVVLLLVFHAKRAAWLGVAAMFAAFAGYTATALIAGRSCGCFGEAIPTRFVLAIDLVGVALGLMLGTPSNAKHSLGVVLSGLAAMATVGAGVFALQAPPTPEQAALKAGATAVERALALPELEDVMSTRAEGPAWLVYFYNPDCDVCREKLPAFEQYQKAHAIDMTMRVRLVNMLELDAKASADPATGVELWAWEDVPTTALVRGGKVERTWGRENTPAPADVRTLALAGDTSGEAAAELDHGARAVKRLMGSPQLADIIAQGPGGPAWLVYVYNPECPKCIETLTLFEMFDEQNPADSPLKTRVLSMVDLVEPLGVQLYEWPGVPTTLLIEDGRLVRTWKDQDPVDPFEVWSRRVGR